jgi:hypothetical protein
MPFCSTIRIGLLQESGGRVMAQIDAAEFPNKLVDVQIPAEVSLLDNLDNQ